MDSSANAKVQRWLSYMHQFDFIIEHIAGSSNVVADALSRVFSVKPKSPTRQQVITSVGQLRPTDDEDDDHERMEATVTALTENQEANTRNEWPTERLHLTFAEVHSALTGHASLADTISHAKEKGCSRTDLRTLAIRWIATCPTCAKTRSHAPPKLEYRSLANFRPFEAVQADFLVGLPTSDKGYSVILAFVDTFTRYCVLYPTYAQTADCACDGFLHLHGLFGTPKRLITDGGPAFISEGFDQFCKITKCDHQVTTPYHPQAHGMVERLNREIIKRAQQVFVDIAAANASNWERYIPIVNRILNTRIHSATGFSPYHLLFGTELANDLNLFSGPPLELDTLDNQTPTEHIRMLDTVLNCCYRAALGNIEDGILQNHAKRPVSEVTFTEGSYVMLTNYKSTTRKLGKFAPLYIGPFRVSKNLQNDFYSLKDLVQDTTSVAHASDLAAFNCTTDAQALQIAKSDYNEFIVSSINSYTQLGDPSKTTGLFFNVTFEDGETQSLIPFKNLLHVDIAREFVTQHKTELPAAYAAMETAYKRSEKAKRIRKSNVRLLDK